MGELAASFRPPLLIRPARRLADVGTRLKLAAAFFGQGGLAPEVEPSGHEGDSAQA